MQTAEKLATIEAQTVPFDFLVQLRASYLVAWVVCVAGFARVIAERPASVEQIPSLIVVTVAFVTIATVTFLALRVAWWQKLVLRDSAALDETKPGLSLLATLAFAFSIYGCVYAFELWTRRAS
jgi:hypothetical protein